MNLSNKDPRNEFALMLAREDHQIDLIEAALLIAVEGRPDIDPNDCYLRIENLAREANDHVDLNQNTRAAARDLCDFLYQHSGYSGDHRDYYNPENSYFDRVLERRKGIPITLALVYICVGRTLGLHVEPVGFPGHFLVKIIGDEEVLVDPFSGQVLSEEDCQELLKICTQGTVTFKPEHLETVSNREVLRRMLNNLKAIYMGREELSEALGVCDRLLMISRDSPRDLLDRAQILEKLECYASAAEDLEYLLTLTPPPQVSEAVREKITALRNRDGGKLH